MWWRYHVIATTRSNEMVFANFRTRVFRKQCLLCSEQHFAGYLSRWGYAQLNTVICLSRFSAFYRHNFGNYHYHWVSYEVDFKMFDLSRYSHYFSMHIWLFTNAIDIVSRIHDRISLLACCYAPDFRTGTFIAAIRSCREVFSRWECGFHWKLCCCWWRDCGGVGSL